jgi:hypothetical protein
VSPGELGTPACEEVVDVSDRFHQRIQHEMVEVVMSFQQPTEHVSNDAGACQILIFGSQRNA